MEANENAMPGATPVSNDSIGGAGAVDSAGHAKPRWDPKGKRNMAIVGGVVLTAVALLVLLFAGGDSQEEKKASTIVEAPADQPVVKGMLSQADREALRAQENERIANALSGGQSAVSNGTGVIQTPAIQAAQAPLTQQGEVRIDHQAQQPPISQAVVQVPAAPDEAKMRGLESQMSRMMTAWGMGAGEGSAQRTLSTYVREPSKSANSAAVGPASQQNSISSQNARPASDVMVIKAYEQPYSAEVLSSADSDTPGKIRARIASGPLAGAVLLGAARRIGDQGFQMDFTSASFNGRTIKVAAYAVDGEVSGDVVRGDYDGRYMQRYVFPVLAEGVKAYAGARAQVATQVIAIPIPGTGAGGSIVTGGQQTPAPTAEQARNAMYSSGANQVSRALATGPQEGHVTLPARTQIGVVFEESIYQSDLAGSARQSGK
jgi:hypothetical protein